MPAIACSRKAFGSTPVASPSHSSVATGPDETLLIRIPFGPSSCERASATLSKASRAQIRHFGHVGLHRLAVRDVA